MVNTILYYMMKMNKNILSLLLIVLTSSCINRTSEDYYHTARHELELFMYDKGLNDSDISKMKLLKLQKDSLTYRYEWYQIAETGDSIFIDTKIYKQWPYSSYRIPFSISFEILNKERMSLRNLFDTTKVNNTNIDKYIELGKNDTLDWIVSKDKIVDHIKRGHYRMMRNTQKPYFIDFFIYIGKMKVRKYEIWTAKVDFLDNNKILITPICLPDSFWDIVESERVGKIYEYKVK